MVLEKSDGGGKLIAVGLSGGSLGGKTMLIWVYRKSLSVFCSLGLVLSSAAGSIAIERSDIQRARDGAQCRDSQGGPECHQTSSSSSSQSSSEQSRSSNASNSSSVNANGPNSGLRIGRLGANVANFRTLSASSNGNFHIDGFLQVMMTDDGYLVFIVRKDIKREYLKAGEMVVINGDPVQFFGDRVGGAIKRAAPNQGGSFYMLYRGNADAINASRISAGLDPVLGLCSGGVVETSSVGGSMVGNMSGAMAARSGAVVSATNNNIQSTRSGGQSSGSGQTVRGESGAGAQVAQTGGGVSGVMGMGANSFGARFGSSGVALPGLMVSGPCGGSDGGGGGCRQGVSPPSMGSSQPNWMSGFQRAGSPGSQASSGGSGPSGSLPDQSGAHDGRGGSTSAPSSSGGGSSGGSSSGSSGGSGTSANGNGTNSNASSNTSPNAGPTEAEFEGVAMVAHESETVDGNRFTVEWGIAIEHNGDYTLTTSIYDGERTPGESPLDSQTRSGNVNDPNANGPAIEHIRQLVEHGQGTVERTRNQIPDCNAAGDVGCGGDYVMTAFPISTPDYVRNHLRQFGSARATSGRSPGCDDSTGQSCNQSGGGGSQAGVVLMRDMALADPLDRYVNPGAGEFISDGGSGTGQSSGLPGHSSCSAILTAVPNGFWTIDCNSRAMGGCDNPAGNQQAMQRLAQYRNAHPQERTSRERSGANRAATTGRASEAARSSTSGGR